MISDPICVFINVNGEIIYNSSRNSISTSDNTKSMLLYPTMILPNIITIIQSSIRDDDVLSAIISIWYCFAIYKMNGLVSIGHVELLTKKVFGACLTHSQICQV